MNILEKEFIHIGTDKIFKELWQNIRMDQTYPFVTKPYGGLYCSNSSEFICDWLNYIELELEDRYEFFSSLPACIIKLKKDSKILMLDNEIDIINLKNSDLIIDYKNNPLIIDNYYYKYEVSFLPNYEKISNIYDAIYINPHIDNAFKKYSITTLLITNPNSIEYYKPIDKNFDKITNIKDKVIIEDLQDNYFKYYKYIENKFKDSNTKNYKKYINELNTIRDMIINDQNNLYNNLNLNFNDNINNQQLLNTITHNIYREKYLLKQKVLHK